MGTIVIRRGDPFTENPNVVTTDDGHVVVELGISRKDGEVYIAALTRVIDEKYYVLAQVVFPADGSYKGHKLGDIQARPLDGKNWDPKARAWVEKNEKELRKRLRAAARTAVEQYVGSKRYRDERVRAHEKQAAGYAAQIERLNRQLERETVSYHRTSALAAAWTLEGEEHDVAMRFLEEGWDGTADELIETAKGVLATVCAPAPTPRAAPRKKR